MQFSMTAGPPILAPGCVHSQRPRQESTVIDDPSASHAFSDRGIGAAGLMTARKLAAAQRK
jgi:hypothetical protein